MLTEKVILEDGFLIKQTLNGNQNAFRFLVLRYQRPIFRLLSSLIYNSAQREEIAQETFLRAFKSLSSYKPETASFSTWLSTIARNLAFNELDKKKVRDTYIESESQSDIPMASGPESALDSAQTGRLVREAIQKLPLEFRTAVLLSCLEGHTLAEIAVIDGCSEGTVKSRIHRGKRILREFLSPILGEKYAENL